MLIPYLKYTISEYTTLIFDVNTISKIHRMSGNYYDDLIFAFFCNLFKLQIIESAEIIFCIIFYKTFNIYKKGTNAN